MSRIFLTTLSLLLLLLAPYAAGEGLKYKNSEFHNLFPFLGRDEDSNTEITGDTPEDRKEFNDRLPYSMPKNAVQSTSKLGQGFYDQSCPDVENIISKAFAQILKDNPGAIAHVIRLQFHDCFVNVSISKQCHASSFFSPNHYYHNQSKCGANISEKK